MKGLHCTGTQILLQVLKAVAWLLRQKKLVDHDRLAPQPPEEGMIAVGTVAYPRWIFKQLGGCRAGQYTITVENDLVIPINPQS